MPDVYIFHNVGARTKWASAVPFVRHPAICDDICRKQRPTVDHNGRGFVEPGGERVYPEPLSLPLFDVEHAIELNCLGMNIIMIYAIEVIIRLSMSTSLVRLRADNPQPILMASTPVQTRARHAPADP